MKSKEALEAIKSLESYQSPRQACQGLYHARSQRDTCTNRNGTGLLVALERTYFTNCAAKYFAVSGSPVAWRVSSFHEYRLPGPKMFFFR